MTGMRRRVRFAVLLMAIAIAGGLNPSFAEYVNVNGPASGEKSHAQIMGDYYANGSAFTGKGTDLGNGLWSEFTEHPDGTGIKARRVDDYGEGFNSTLDIIYGKVGESIDKFWSDGIARVTAAALQAGYTNQTFGWNEGGGIFPKDFTKIISWGEDPVDFAVSAGHFLWGDQLTFDGGYLWWSDPAGNLDDYPMDHMVTYKVEDLSDPEYLGRTVWLLFWEDLPSSSWDQDYNDFVVEIRAIPEPTTICLLGLGALGLLCRRRKCR